MKDGGGVVIVHLAEAAAEAAAVPRVNARRAAVLAETLIDRIKMILILVLPFPYFQTIKIPTMILVLNPCKKLAARKLTNAHTVVLYSEEKEVLWLLSFFLARRD